MFSGKDFFAITLSGVGGGEPFQVALPSKFTPLIKAR